MAVPILSDLIDRARQGLDRSAGKVGIPSLLPPPPPADLAIRQSQPIYTGNGTLDHLHLFTREVHEGNGKAYDTHRVVRLLALQAIPAEQRQQATMVARAIAFLQGAYTSSVDIIRLNVGLFAEPRLGIVQMWGIRTEGPSYKDALASSAEAFAVLRAGLPAVYEKSRWRPPDTEVFEATRSLFQKCLFGLVQIGHPAPRETVRGPLDTDAETMILEALQQVEAVYRGMAQLGEDFLHLVLAVRLAEGEVMRLSFANAEELSTVESAINGNAGLSFSLGMPVMISKALGSTAGSGYGIGEQRGESESWGESDMVGESEGYAYSEQQGEAYTVGRAETFGEAHSVAVGRSVSQSQGRSVADSVGHGQTVGVSHSVSRAESHGVAHSVTDTEGVTVTDGQAISEGSQRGQSKSWGTSGGRTETESRGVNLSVGGGHAVGTHQSRGHSVNAGVSAGENWSEGYGVGQSRTIGGAHSVNVNVGGNVGIAAPIGVEGKLGDGVVPGAIGLRAGVTPSIGLNAGLGVSEQENWSEGLNVSEQHTRGGSGSVSMGVGTDLTEGQSETQSHNWSRGQDAGQSIGQSVGWNAQRAASQGSSRAASDQHSVAQSSSRSVGVTESRSVTHGESYGESYSESHSRAHTEGSSQSVGQGASVSEVHARSHAITHSEAHTVSRSQGETWSRSTSQAHSESVGVGRTQGIGIGRQVAMAASSATGVSAGLAPGVGFHQSWQTKDVRAEEYALILRRQQEVLQLCQQLGAWWTDSYWAATGKAGLKALAGLVASGFRGAGETVVTPVTLRVLNREEQAYIALHAAAFSPSRRIAPLEVSWETYWDSTLLPSSQLAAMIAPGLFEEGIVNTTREAMPPFRLEPRLQGDICLGHQISYEREEVTRYPFVLNVENTHNIGIFGDTGMGKSHQVMWLAYEVATKHDQAVIILDMSATNRGLKHVLGERVSFFSLYPGGPNPVPWNPMQIGGRVGPTAHKNAILESVCAIGGLGQRQASLLNDALRNLYLEHGALTDDEEQILPTVTNWRVSKDLNSPYAKKMIRWSTVKGAVETDLVDRVRAARGAQPVPKGSPLRILEAPELKALARERSKAITLPMLYELVSKLANRKNLNSRDQEAFSGIVARLTYFREGPLGRMFSRSVDSVSFNDLLRPGHVVVLETGVTPEMKEEAKAILLNLAFLSLYMERAYLLAERGERAAQAVPTWVVLEEANKVLTPSFTDSDDAGKATTSAQMETIARDCRKFGLRLVLTGQNPSLIPTSIITNCNTLIAGKLKGVEDRKVMVAAFAKSESGFRDEDYKRWLSSIKKHWFVGLLALEEKNWKADPICYQGLEMPTYAPSDAELRAYAADSQKLPIDDPSS